MNKSTDIKIVEDIKMVSELHAIGVDGSGTKIASWVGNERGARNAIYIILGTGIESSIPIGGKLYDGA